MNTPQTLHAHGHEWIPHAPGNPMPCEPGTNVYTLLRDYEATDLGHRPAKHFDWQALRDYVSYEIIGWRYATQPQEPQEPIEFDQLESEYRATLKTFLP